MRIVNIEFNYGVLPSVHKIGWSDTVHYILYNQGVRI